MGFKIDETGNQYGDLTVLKYDENKSHDKKNYWECKCSCGNIISIRGDELRSGKRICCPECSKKRKSQKLIKDIEIGTVFGDLVVLEQDMSNNKNGAYWVCRCSCGNIMSIRGTELRTGKKIQCPKCFREKLKE